MPEPVAKRRPKFDSTVRALLEDVASRMEEFAHIQPARILVVAGEARRASRATVKPLTFPARKSIDVETGLRRPVIRVHGKRMLYAITLRPLFFRGSSARGRVTTILHELFHISKNFDGTLSEHRRHATMGEAFAASLRPLVKRYWAQCPPELKTQFAYDGEVKILQWLERPGLFYVKGKDSSRKIYSEEQLFEGTMRMITRKPGGKLH